MHARMIRRNFAQQWRRILVVGVAVLGFEMCLLYSASAHAEVNVAYVTVTAEDSYASERVYAGRTVAGRAAELGFKIGGEVETLLADIGDVVAAGEPLARLDSRAIDARRQQAAADVSLARANIEALQAETQLARNTAERIENLRERGHASQQTYDETQLNLRAKAAQLQVAEANLARAKAALRAVEVELSEAVVNAPFPGVIQARHVDEGAQVGPGQIVLRLVENSRTEAHVGIPAEVSVQLKPNDTYTIRWNDTAHEARLTAVLPEIDPATRTLTAVFELGESGIPLGGVVELTFKEKVATPGFWLPLTALTASDRGLWGVYVVDADNTVQRRLVEVVHTDVERVFVRGTLSNDDRVIATGVQRVVPGQTVNPVAQQTELRLSYAR